MRIYNSAFEMVREVERDLWEMGIKVQSETMQDKDVHKDKDYETVEVQGYDYRLTDWTAADIEKMVTYMKGNPLWLSSEFEDRVSNMYLNPGYAYVNNVGVWNEYLRDGQFAYTYNERFRGQLSQLIRELAVRPNTRQAVLTVYDWHQDMGNWGGKDRVPCSMYYQFYNREGRTHMIYTMRSCDFLTHFCHDVALALMLLEYVADKLGNPKGMFTHFIGSLHAYHKDMKARGIF
jgi:thymidylate synthase